LTNTAATEMRERVQTLLGKRKARGLTLATFHSLGVRILKSEIDKLGYATNFNIYDTSDQMSIIKEALKHFHAEKANFDRKIVLSKIGLLKNNGISDEDFVNSAFFDDQNAYDHATEFCYRFYQDKLRFYNAIDFDDILFLVVKLFHEFPEVAQKYSRQFQYVMIDEYQDTNDLQFQLALGLTSTHKNICVAGDDDRDHSFRCNINNILNFEKHFGSAAVIKLEENYRSTQAILNLANHVIKENTKRREKTLWTKKETSDQPVLWLMGNTDHESQVIVEEIVQHQANGIHLADIAVLYRSNTQAAPIEEQLRAKFLTIIGGQKFYDKKVKDLMGYLSLINNTFDEMSA
jgi:superfamily I DNA/RNA helicase